MFKRSIILSILAASLAVMGFGSSNVTYADNEPACFPVVRLDSVAVLSGLNATVTVSVERIPPVGGMDLVLCYDPTLAFLSAEPIRVMADWEYFTFRMSEEDTCGGDCPKGVLRLIGIADMPDGNDPDPSVYLPNGPIIELTLATPADLNHVGDCFDIQWCWYDCGDNAFSSPQGDSLYVAYNLDAQLPDGKCLETDEPIVPTIRFMDGKICVVPPTDDGIKRGDCNNDGIIDIADIVYWLNYVFSGGPEPVGDLVCGSFCRADFRCDGRINIADIVFLIQYVLYQRPAPSCVHIIE